MTEIIELCALWSSLDFGYSMGLDLTFLGYITISRGTNPENDMVYRGHKGYLFCLGIKFIKGIKILQTLKKGMFQFILICSKTRSQIGRAHV